MAGHVSPRLLGVPVAGGEMHRRARAQIAAPAILFVLSLVVLPRLDGHAVRAAAPNVREVTPAGISIDGSRSDWDSPNADYLANM